MRAGARGALFGVLLVSASCLKFHPSDDLPVCIGFDVCTCTAQPGCSFCEDPGAGSCALVNSRKCMKETSIPPPMCTAQATGGGPTGGGIPSGGGAATGGGSTTGGGVASDCMDLGAVACGSDGHGFKVCESSGTPPTLHTKDEGSCPDNGTCTADLSSNQFQCSSRPGVWISVERSACSQERMRGCGIHDDILICSNGEWHNFLDCSAAVPCKVDNYEVPDGGVHQGLYYSCGGDGRVKGGEGCFGDDRPTVCTLDRRTALRCSDAGIYELLQDCAGSGLTCQGEGVCQ